MRIQMEAKRVRPAPIDEIWRRLRGVVWVHFAIRVAIAAVHLATSYAYLLIGAPERFITLYESAIFAWLGITVSLCYYSWEFLPRSILREFDDVEKFLHNPQCFEAYRTETHKVAAHISRVYYALILCALAFFMFVTFVGSSGIPWLTVDFATFLFRVVMMPIEGIMALFVVLNLPIAIPATCYRLTWKTAPPSY
jgi:hypothetical protein